MVNSIVSWTGILVAGPTNLIIPALIYLAMSKKRAEVLSSRRKAEQSPSRHPPASVRLDQKRLLPQDEDNEDDCGDDEKRLLPEANSYGEDDEYDSFSPNVRCSSSSESYVTLPIEWELRRKLMAYGIITMTVSVMIYAATVEGTYGVKKEF
mmetsp:Transcript_23560/g.37840  ORF Transcript_23560/g.37840 Transcript_23560/m.37840 type:complete len:152 (-) Transcript_23560:255-710(-)